MTTTGERVASLRERICTAFNDAADLRDKLPPGSPEKRAVREAGRLLDRALTKLDDMLDEMGLVP